MTGTASHPSASTAHLRLGEQVHQLHERRGMSQDDLASQIGVSVDEIQEYESGAERIPAGMLFRIANVFDIRSTELFKEPAL